MTVDTISTDSPALISCLELLLELSFSLVVRYAASEMEEDDVLMVEQARPRVIREFREDVFCKEAVIDRNEFIERVAEFASWVFNSQKIRDRMQQAAIDNFEEEDEGQ